MKVLVCFEPSIKHDVFEATRLRKNIKGALEEMNIELSSSSLENCDVVHFLSIKDEKKILDAIELGKKTVISVLSTENDVICKITHIDDKGNRRILPKAVKLLNKMDAVVVPSLCDKYFLVSEGISTHIEIIEPGVSLKRFHNIDNKEKELFYRYFGERNCLNIVTAVGDFSKTKEINKLISLAALLPTIKFYFFGVDTSPLLVSRAVNKYNKKATSNLVFSPVVEDDIYRSTLVASKIFVVLNPNSVSSVSVEDALAAENQLLVFAPLKENSFLEDGKDCYVVSSVLEASHFIRDYTLGYIPSTVHNGLKKAKKTSLNEIGKKLVKLYEKLLGKEGD